MGTDKHERMINQQRRIAKQFEDLSPTEVQEVYWLYAERKKGSYPHQTQKGGKWLIFINKNETNEYWSKIKRAVEDGKLGRIAKVATKRENPNAENPNIKVICVYTYDYEDLDDVKRIRNELRTLGITWKIPYKSNKATLAGKYRKRGNNKISSYFE